MLEKETIMDEKSLKQAQEQLQNLRNPVLVSRKHEEDVCGVTKLPCCHCNPGACGNRIEPKG